MYIQTNDNYPVISERNKRIHVPSSVGEVAIYNRTATAVAPAKRGTNEYLQERAALTASLAPPVAPPTISWSVRAGGGGDGLVEKRPAIYAVCSSANCAVRFRYEGQPEYAETVTFTHSCGSHAPARVPADIVELYSAACTNHPLTEIPADEARAIRMARSKDKDSGKREVDHGKPLLNKDGTLYKLFFEKKKA
jgi:hypothetical protein